MHSPTTSPAASGFHPRNQSWALLPLVVGGAFIAFVFLLSRDIEHWRAWSSYLWWPKWPVFGDLSDVLSGLAAGGGDANLRERQPGNYPHWWLWFGSLGLNRLNGSASGLALDVAWLVCLLWIWRIDSLGKACACALALASAPVRLALERANLDLAMFILCVSAAKLMARRRGDILASILVTVAALLKLYPAAAFSLALFAKQYRQKFHWWAISVSALAFGWITSWREMHAIANRAARQFIQSGFGCEVLPNVVAQKFFFNAPQSDAARATLISRGLLLVVAIAAVWIGANRARLFYHIARHEHAAKFLVGSSIYCGTFALGYNFAYRLIFVLAFVPLLWSAAFEDRTSPLAIHHWACLTLVLATGCLLAPFDIVGWAFAAKQVCDWALAAALMVGSSGIVFSLHVTARSETPHASS